MKSRSDTSWHAVGKWYDQSVGDRGQYYHEHVVLPGALRLLHLEPDDSLLDLGCGQGVLARAGAIPKTVTYVGVDSAASLISFAKQRDLAGSHHYFVGDVTQPLSISEKFTHVAIILALQNMEDPVSAIKNAADHLEPAGKLVIILNHPAFRIPRQSAWGTDEGSKIQYRRENIYMSPLKIPVTMHPGEAKGPVTWSFHEPISAYAKMLSDNGFVIGKLEEWTSDRESAGKAAKMENRSRSEFPLFLAISARLDRAPHQS